MALVFQRCQSEAASGPDKSSGRHDAILATIDKATQSEENYY